MPLAVVHTKSGSKGERLYGYQAERDASLLLIQTLADLLHLLDFGALPGADFFAQCDKFRVGQGGFAAHEDRAGVVRDHGVDELVVTDECLCAGCAE